jgi:hypothetical protein
MALVNKLIPLRASFHRRGGLGFLEQMPDDWISIGRFMDAGR